jgi:hypothetical protein
LAGNSFFIFFIIESGTLYVKEILIKKIMQGVGDPWFSWSAIHCLISIDRPLLLSYIQPERSAVEKVFSAVVLFHQPGR